MAELTATVYEKRSLEGKTMSSGVLIPDGSEYVTIMVSRADLPDRKENVCGVSLYLSDNQGKTKKFYGRFSFAGEVCLDKDGVPAPESTLRISMPPKNKGLMCFVEVDAMQKITAGVVVKVE